MPLPRKLLASGEQILLESRPHWSRLVPRLVLALAVVGACIAVFLTWSSAPIFVGWILLGIGLAGVGSFLARWLGWRASTLTITTVRISYRRGVIHRFGREIPLQRVRDVTFRQSLFGRIIGVGELSVESGERGQEPFFDIRRPAQVQSLISRLVAGAPPAPAPSRSRAGAHLIDEADDDETPRQPMRAVPGPGHSPAEQLLHLYELHRHGVLTDAELEAKRRELLEP